MKQKLSENFNFIGIGITILIIAVLSFFIDIEMMKVWVTNAGVWAPLAFIVLKIMTIVIAPLSGGPLYLLVGILFGFWPGILYVAIGDFIGYTINFFLSRALGRKYVEKMLSGREESILSKIIEHVGTPKGFFQAFLTAFISPELLSYAAGLSKLKYRYFISILWTGYLIVSSILVLLGSTFSKFSDMILVSLGIPLVAGVCIYVGASWFMDSIKNEENN